MFVSIMGLFVSGDMLSAAWKRQALVRVRGPRDVVFLRQIASQLGEYCRENLIAPFKFGSRPVGVLKALPSSEGHELIPEPRPELVGAIMVGQLCYVVNDDLGHPLIRLDIRIENGGRVRRRFLHKSIQALGDLALEVCDTDEGFECGV